MVGLSLSLDLGPPHSALYDPDAAALIARFTTPPTTARAILITSTILQLKSAGLWTKLEVLYFLAAADSQAALLNWISTSFNATAVNSPTFTADKGFAGDGATSYLNTGWIANNSTITTINSQAMGTWINAGTDSASDTLATIGAVIDGTGTGYGDVIYPRGTTGIRGRISRNSNDNLAPSPSTNRGLTAMSRTTSVLTTAYKNGAANGTSANASQGRSTYAVFIGGYNQTGVLIRPSDFRHAFAFIGAGLSAAEMLSLYTIVLAYLTAVGGQ